MRYRESDLYIEEIDYFFWIGQLEYQNKV